MVLVEVDTKQQRIALLKKSVFEMRFVAKEKDRYLVETHQQCLQEVNRIIQMSNETK
jgi:hypothetical protein